MSTRGAMGVRIDGKDKLTYNHFDSYPSGLGEDIVDELRKMRKKLGWDKIKELAKAVRLVKSEGTPKKKDIEKFVGFSDVGVSNQTVEDWYCLLRDLQGELQATLEAGVMIDGKTFILDSLFCEWAYIVNLDTMKLEVYKGFQSAPHTAGRFAKIRGKTFKERNARGGDAYYPCALILEVPLDRLPTSLQKSVNKVLPPEDEE